MGSPAWHLAAGPGRHPGPLSPALSNLSAVGSSFFEDGEEEELSLLPPAGELAAKEAGRSMRPCASPTRGCATAAAPRPPAPQVPATAGPRTRSRLATSWTMRCTRSRCGRAALLGSTRPAARAWVHRKSPCLRATQCCTQVALFKPPDPATLEGGGPRTGRLGGGGGSSSGGSSQSDEPFFSVQDVLPSRRTSEW